MNIFYAGECVRVHMHSHRPHRLVGMLALIRFKRETRAGLWRTRTLTCACTSRQCALYNMCAGILYIQREIGARTYAYFLHACTRAAVLRVCS